MSEFACEVVRISIEEHPNADAIEIARVGGYQCIVKKGQFQTGDLAVYIPEQALVPEWLLMDLGMWDVERRKGGLSGSAGNRVKAIKLRGIVSQGLLLGGTPGSGILTISAMKDAKHSESPYGAGVSGRMEEQSFSEGDDAAEFLGITKYSPAIPASMRAKIAGVDLDVTHKYDFENIKKRPTIFKGGDEVVMTEKIHGTFIQIGVVPTSKANERYYKDRVIVSSKGMGANGYILDHTDEGNLYAQCAKKHGLFDKMLEKFGEAADTCEMPIFIMGEVFGTTETGASIQDLTYSDEPLAFRAFDMCVGAREQAMYMPWDALTEYCVEMDIPVVPLLYRGPFDESILDQHTNGLTSFVAPRGKLTHMREGVVIKCAYEIADPRYGRRIAKSISDKYLLRKNATEFN